MSRRKSKPFRATKDVKRRARSVVGSPPPVQRYESRKRKPPKHKKLVWKEEADPSDV
jgi:hypothetical protein